MSNNLDIEKFLNDYEALYFKDSSKASEYKVKIKNQTDPELEKIICQYLTAKTIDEYGALMILGWKFGKIKLLNNELQATSNWADTVNAYYYGFNKDTAKESIKKLNLPDSFKEAYESCYVSVGGYFGKCKLADLKNLINCVVDYRNDNGFDGDLLSQIGISRNGNTYKVVGGSLLHHIQKTSGFGITYMMTLVYFLSKCKYPIYDRYALIGLRALTEDINPCSNKTIAYKSCPQKTEIKKVVEFLTDDTKRDSYAWYQKQINDIFHIYENGKVDISQSRKVDRALWVYGHLFKAKSTDWKLSKTYTNL